MSVDLYSGFEGEPEIIIAVGRESIISTWNGYFDELMALAEPSPTGWQGIFHHYHCSDEWDGFDAWQDPDPELTLSQLLSLPGTGGLSDEARLLLTTYIDCLRRAIARNLPISIREA
jgi:hypothetical protein